MLVRNNIEFSLAEPHDFKDIYLFHRAHFGEIRSEYIWQWQYGDENPLPSVLVVGRANGAIVATQGAMVINLIVNGSSVVTGKNESLLIDPQYRKRGVFSDLYLFAFNEYQKAGMDCIWGFTKAKGPFERVGFSFDRAVQRTILPLASSAALKIAKVDKMSNPKKLIYRVISVVSTIYSTMVFNCKTRFIVKRPHFEILDNLKFVSDIQSLFIKLRDTNPNLIHIDFNEKYLEWRIEKSPNRISSHYAYSGDILEGYLILEKRDEYLDILDFAFLTEDAGFEIMKVLYRRVSTDKIGFISYSGNRYNFLNRKVFRFLAKFGFFTIKGPNGFVLKVFNKIEKGQDLSNWYITSLWYEGN